MASCKNTMGMTSTFSSKNTVPGGILITDSNEIFWSSQTRWEISHKISLTQWREQKAACLLRERSLKPKIVWSVLKNPCTKRYTSSIWGKWELHISICIWETGQSSICYTSTLLDQQKKIPMIFQAGSVATQTLFSPEAYCMFTYFTCFYKKGFQWENKQ